LCPEARKGLHYFDFFAEQRRSPQQYGFSGHRSQSAASERFCLCMRGNSLGTNGI
jgi:hypothetical protein